MRQAIAELKIGNASAVQMRIEDYAPMQLFDTVICRAFASLPDFIRGAGRLVAPGGRLLAMKGRLPADELAALPEGWRGRGRDAGAGSRAGCRAPHDRGQPSR